MAKNFVFLFFIFLLCTRNRQRPTNAAETQSKSELTIQLNENLIKGEKYPLRLK
jgi:hypothetical protein